jgi:hypothetical protein
MRRRWVDRVQDGCVAAMRGELVGLQASVEESLNATVEAMRQELRSQQTALDTIRRGDREERALFAGALDRLVGVLDSLTGALELERRERLAQTELVERLLRETLVHRTPAASPAQLVGGSIDATVISEEATTIDLRPPGGVLADQLVEGAAVQVRSQFQDRWTDGFIISRVKHEAGHRQIQLTRASDGTKLPVWFDAADVRAADRSPAPFVAPGAGMPATPVPPASPRTSLGPSVIEGVEPS